MEVKNRDFERVFFEGILEQNPNHLDALQSLAEFYTRKGLYQEGFELDRRLAALCPKDPIVHYNLACSLVLVGEKAKALDTLRRAIELGYDDLQYLRRDKDFKPLHGDPQFEGILATLHRTKP